MSIYCKKTYKKEYKAWRMMKNRCYNKNSNDYKDYGERGIIVDDKWISCFDSFLDDVGPSPSKSHSLDRIYVNGNYQTGNVKWSTQKEQQNNRRDNYYITYNNQTKTLSQWCDFLNINVNTIKNRIFYLNWSDFDALSTPIGRSNNKNKNRYPRKVIKIDSKTNSIIATFNSISEAVKSGHATDASCVIRCCKGESSCHNKSKWQYAN